MRPAPRNESRIMKKLLTSIRRSARRAFGGDSPRARSEYGAVWNAVSRSETEAKYVVSGYVDEETYRATGEATVGILREHVGVNPDDVILEIGAGVGRVGAALAPLCREWIGVDASENMARHIRQRLARFKNVRAICNNGFDLSAVDSASIDLVYSTVVFMHLDEWDRYGYLVEAFRVLKPGGRVFVDNYTIANDAGWKFFEEHRAIKPALRAPQISRMSTPQELEIYLTRAGFSGVRHSIRDLWVQACGVKPGAG